jgi:isochorismate pyruvate lyase
LSRTAVLAEVLGLLPEIADVGSLAEGCGVELNLDQSSKQQPHKATENRMKTPESCSTLQDVRDAIDEIDREVVQLLGKRSGFVHAAAAFKTSEESVRAPERFAAMLMTRRQWAEESGLAPDFVELLYRDIVAHFTATELQQFREQPDVSK